MVARETEPTQRSAALRAWHWLDSLVVFGLLGTVLLRETFLDKSENARIIAKQLAEQGIAVSPDQMVSVAKALREPMWTWHYYFGFTLLLLVLVRGALFIFGNQRAVWKESLLGDAALRRAVLHGQHHALDPWRVRLGWVYCLYLVFYLAMAFQSVSGALLFINDLLQYPILGASSLEDVHEAFLWVFTAFVAVHIVGVLLAEVRHRRAVVSAMIGGGEES